MKCERCGASEQKYFYKETCRRCIHLKAHDFDDRTGGFDSRIDLPFKLSDYQKEISKNICDTVLKGDSVYLNAVCGAGKTEMCLELIASALRLNYCVGWAIPRRQVVLELKQRLQSYFPKLDVIAVCGGHTSILEGDLVLCTTHQLYRFTSYFDILILDEPDAFPYFENEMLEHIMHKSVKGPIVYLSATLELKDPSIKKISVDLRPSRCLLPVPKCSFSLVKTVKSLWLWRKETVLIFVPTLKLAKKVSLLLGCPYVSSQSTRRESIIEDFRVRGGFLVCTTILERGVTFKDCFVMVLYADHRVFTTSSLIQIAGRVGRGINPQKGTVFFWQRSYSEAVNKACLKIQDHNRSAHSVLMK